MRVFKSAVAHSVNADKQRSFKDRCVTDPTMFRVMSVMSCFIKGLLPNKRIANIGIYILLIPHYYTELHNSCQVKMSRSISRVLSWTVIYLDGGLLPPLKPFFVAHRANVSPHLTLLQIGFTVSRCSHVTGELLPRLSTLTLKIQGGISLLHFP